MKTSYLIQLGIVKALWRKACRHDGIDSQGKLTVLSCGNPYFQEYTKQIEVLMKLRELQTQRLINDLKGMAKVEGNV